MPEASARLFVALAVPPTVAEALVGLQPEAGPAVRLTLPSDMHVTLHFLGEASIGAVRAALSGARAEPFVVGLSGCARFSTRQGRSICHVAVEASDGLVALHAELARVLTVAGFVLEDRRFVPHITLARLGARAPASLAKEFERQRLPAAAQVFACDRFELYASGSGEGSARYRVISSYALGAVEPIEGP